MTADPTSPRQRDLPTPVPLEPGADLTVLDNAKILAAPDDPADWPRWREALDRWRCEARQRHRYDDALYRRPQLEWARRCFAVCVAWLWDELLYDIGEERFTPETFLRHGQERFGGYDAVVLWHAYPLLGLDDRNQFDYYRDVPGLRALVRDLQGAGVAVFVNYNPWDTATRDAGRSHDEELESLVTELNADGIFLDTMREAPNQFAKALAETYPTVALASESTLPLSRVVDHAMSWAQWWADSATPGVMRTAWFEQRHVLHHTRRWSRDHTAEIHSAFLNGAGVLVWDNVFGAAVPWSKRDRATLRTMLRVQRQFVGHLRDGRWTPLADRAEACSSKVFASRWGHGDSVLWTIVNRGDTAWEGPLLELDAQAFAGFGFVEPVSGAEIPVVAAGDRLVVAGRIDSRGTHAVLATRTTPAQPPPQPSCERDASQSESPDVARRVYRVAPPTVTRTVAPPGFALLPEGTLPLTYAMRRRECGGLGNEPFPEYWKPLPPLLHSTACEECVAQVGAAAVQKSTVSNGDFAEFLRATAWRPRHSRRLLQHWVDGHPPQGEETAPVVYVGLDDARAYAAWKGWRLPTEHEWRVGADAGLLTDLGSVREWTESEHADGRTRFVLLVGHRSDAPDLTTRSDWYLDPGRPDPAWLTKVLRAGAGLDRSPEVGFRCAVDLQTERENR